MKSGELAVTHFQSSEKQLHRTFIWKKTIVSSGGPFTDMVAPQSLTCLRVDKKTLKTAIFHTVIFMNVQKDVTVSTDKIICKTRFVKLYEIPFIKTC